MRLVIKRGQNDKKGVLGGHKGVTFSLATTVEFSEEERGLLEHYKMWDYPVLTRGGMPISIRELSLGRSETVENVELLLNNEAVLKSSLDSIPPLLEVLRSFGGDDVVEYPRSQAGR